ncbi:MAG TPA: hypothetical protein VF941_00200 [Clostridia bacterium]
MSKSLEYAKEITVAALSSYECPADQSYGQCVSEFFEEVYKKIKYLEESESSEDGIKIQVNTHIPSPGESLEED